MAAVPDTSIINNKYIEPPIEPNQYKGTIKPGTAVNYPELVIPLPDGPGGKAGNGFFGETLTAYHSLLTIHLRNDFLTDGEGAPIIMTDVQAKMSAADEWFQICNTGEGTDPWNMGIYPVVVCGPVPPQYLNYGESSWFVLDVSAFYAVRFIVAAQYTGADTQFSMSTLLKNGNGGTFVPTAIALG